LLYRSLLKVARKFDGNVGAKTSLLRAVYPHERPSIIKDAALQLSVQQNVKARFRSNQGSLSNAFGYLKLFSSMYSYCSLWTNILGQSQENVSMKKGVMALIQIIDPNYDCSSFQRELDSLTNRARSVINYNKKYNNNNNTLTKSDNNTNGVSDVRNELEAINQIIFSEKLIKEVKALSTLNLRAASMCTVYQTVASGVGVQLNPVESSGYFLLKYQPEEGETLIIDALKDGKVLTLEEANSSFPNLRHLDGRSTNLKLLKLIDLPFSEVKDLEFGAYALMHALPSARENGMETEGRKDITESRKETENKKKIESENVIKKQETVAPRKKGASV